MECTSISTHWGTSQLIKLKNLTKLNLFNLRLFDSEHLKALAFNCERLEYLNIEEVTHLSEDSVITLIQARTSEEMDGKLPRITPRGWMGVDVLDHELL